MVYLKLGNERKMNSPIKDKSKFWQVAPAADEIFSYVKSKPEISNSPWGFDSGNMSDNLDQVWASFSCMAISGWGNDKLTVTAKKQMDKTWTISHNVTRVK